MIFPQGQQSLGRRWIQGEPGHLPPRVDPVVEVSIQYLRKDLGCEKIGAVGYCFGAKYVVRFLHPNKNQIDVGYLAHPSMIESDELSIIGGPLSIAAAEIDNIFPSSKRHETEDILGKSGKEYQLTLYSGVAHGFATRADVRQRNASFAQRQAFTQAVSWFEEYL